MNRATSPRKVSFDWRAEKVADSLSNREARFDTTKYKLKDLWSSRDRGTTARILTADVPPHDVLMFRLKKM